MIKEKSVVRKEQTGSKMPEIILASASPRRRELMTRAGYQFSVIPARGEEIITGTHPADVVEELSLQKASEVADRILSEREGSNLLNKSPASCNVLNRNAAGASGEASASDGPDMFVIGADTVVAIDHRILGKPRDQEEARRMITELQGNVHQVYTGVTVIRLGRNDPNPESMHMSKVGVEPERDFKNFKSESYSCLYRKDIHTFHECTDVHVFPMTVDEIEKYICTREPYDKAGAYGIQGSFAIYIEGIRGDYNNVVGLPIARLYHVLREMI